MKNYLVTLVLLVVSFAAPAQVTVNSKQLVGTTWKVVEPHGRQMEQRWAFSSKQIIKTLHSPYLKSSTPLKYSFYLSPKYQIEFDHSKAGTQTSGCYLQAYNQKNKGFDSWYIKSFDMEKGLMTITGRIKAPKGKRVVGGGWKVTLTLQRISPK